MSRQYTMIDESMTLIFDCKFSSRGEASKKTHPGPSSLVVLRALCTCILLLRAKMAPECKEKGSPGARYFSMMVEAE